MTRDHDRPADPRAATPELAELLEGRLLDDGRTPDGELMRAMVRQRLFGGPEPAFRFDRFIVLERVGHGGMGVVYEAYDPQLERKIALKVVRPASSAEDTPTRERMLREARALARLSHPNVVPVFEAGEHGDDLFIAMELVRGETLRSYGQAPGRTARALVDAYVQAGRGLAAAHAVGLVHRDFKPSNAIVGEDGRVRVLDFGLARDAGWSTPAGFRWTPDAIAPAGVETLTPTGAIVGTPAYMAPEQRFGEPVTPASDQYSLCASLHEALVGSLPTVDLERMAVRVGSLPRGARRLRPVLARGLSMRPEDRWPSMDALCNALERANHPRRTVMRSALVLGLAGVVGAAALLPRQSPCATDDDVLAGVWDDTERRAVEAALLGTSVEYAPALARDATRALDGYAQRWTELREQTCVAHHVDRSTSAELFDRAMACLERRRSHLETLVERLGAVDARSAPRVMDALQSLRPLEPCRDREALLAALPPPEDPAVAERVVEARHWLDASVVAVRLGNLDEALALAERGVAIADALAHRPIQAEAAFVLGKLRLTRRELDEAEAGLDEAVWLAEAGRHDELAADAASELVVAQAMRGRLDAARAQARRASAAIERLGRRSRADVVLESGLGNIARFEGKLEEARDHYARAYEHAEQLGLDSVSLGGYLDNLAAMHASLGEHDRALELWQRAYELKRSGLGEEHPSVLATRLHIGISHLQVGRPDEALALMQGVLDDVERNRIEVGDLLAFIHNSLATAYNERGRHAEAVVHAERAVATFRETLGSDNPQLIGLLMTLGVTLVDVGRSADARATFEEAVALGRATEGDDAYLAGALLGLANLERSDDAAASLRHAEEALRMLERTVGARHPELSRGHRIESAALHALGDLAGATTAARRAIETVPASGFDLALARASVDLAELLAEQGSIAEAREHTRAALAAYERLGDEEGVQRMRTWLQELEAR